MVDDALARAREAARSAADRLSAADAPQEDRAELVLPRKILWWQRAEIMRPLGRVWHLGTLLLDADASLFAVGRSTRAAERRRPNHQSLSQEERRDIAAAALSGGFATGSTVNYDTFLLPLDGSPIPEGAPIGISDDAVRVRWRHGAPLSGAPTLAEYLDERVALLIEPPFPV